MTIHKLALFWRAQEARCFTYVHFQAGHAPRARAYEILEALAQLSQSQLYGFDTYTKLVKSSERKDRCQNL